jgi:hypothetical protein
MHRLEPAFRRRFIELGARQGFSKLESKMARLLLRRETSANVLQESGSRRRAFFWMMKGL